MLKSEIKVFPDQVSLVAEDRGVGLKGWLAGPKRKESRTETSTEARLDRHRLAVLPLSNISPDRQDEYFADGLTEELISTACAISGLTVIARTSVMRYKGAAKGAREIGRELNAGTLLEGSVRKSGSRLRVTVQLIDAESEGHLWSDSFDKEMQDIFAVQTEIARQVAGSLALKLTDKEKRIIEARSTVSTEAYNLYLRGRYFWNQRTKDAIVKAIELFEQAVEEDPKYALAYAGLSDAYGISALYGYAPPSETIAKGKKYASKALELDQRLAEAHASMAVILLNEWDYEGYGRELQAALQLNPSYAYAHQHYGDYIFYTRGDLDRSMGEWLRARELDPFSPITNLNVCVAYVTKREYGRAIVELRRSLELFPDFWSLHLYLGLALAMDGRFEESLREVEVVASTDKVLGVYARGIVDGLWGKIDQAREAIEELESLSKTQFVSPITFAPLFAAMGDRDGAFRFLDRAFEEKSTNLPGEILGYPLFEDKLGLDPRWKELRAKLGLNPSAATK